MKIEGQKKLMRQMGNLSKTARRHMVKAIATSTEECAQEWVEVQIQPRGALFYPKQHQMFDRIKADRTLLQGVSDSTVQHVHLKALQ